MISEVWSRLFHFTDQTEKVDFWQESQKRSRVEIHSGPDPPGGGRYSGLCQLCKFLSHDIGIWEMKDLFSFLIGLQFKLWYL